jgi:tRNA pseudouridine(55) synthase
MKTGVIWKNIGETPLQAIRRFRIRSVITESVPLSYSGRLDPMAEGKILVLVGDECKAERKYRQMDKEYEVEILLGVSTDTGDILGIPHIADLYVHPNRAQVKTALNAFVGTHAWPYPHYSSKPVRGKALHVWAREGKLHEIELPLTNSRIDALYLVEMHEVKSHELRRLILARIHKLSEYNGGKPCTDFRQPEIEKAWDDAFEATLLSSYVVIRCRCISGSGTYMRTLAERVGKALSTQACALSIKRTKIGKRRNLLGFHFWWPSW